MNYMAKKKVFMQKQKDIYILFFINLLVKVII